MLSVYVDPFLLKRKKNANYIIYILQIKPYKLKSLIFEEKSGINVPILLIGHFREDPLCGSPALARPYKW